MKSIIEKLLEFSIENEGLKNETSSKFPVDQKLLRIEKWKQFN